MAEPKAPKMDLKMLVFPAMMFLGSKIDFKDPDVVFKAQIGFITMLVGMASLYFYLYYKLAANPDKTKHVWVPPKAAPQMPWVEAIPPRMDEYVEISYFNHGEKA